MRVKELNIELSTASGVPFVPPHRPGHEWLVEEILESMRGGGWVGRPLIVLSLDGTLEGARAWTGSHRIEALKRLLAERGSAHCRALVAVAENDDDRRELLYALGASSQRLRRVAAQSIVSHCAPFRAVADALEDERIENLADGLLRACERGGSEARETWAAVARGEAVEIPCHLGRGAEVIQQEDARVREVIAARLGQ